MKLIFKLFIGMLVAVSFLCVESTTFARSDRADRHKTRFTRKVERQKKVNGRVESRFRGRTERSARVDYRKNTRVTRRKERDRLHGHQAKRKIIVSNKVSNKPRDLKHKPRKKASQHRRFAKKKRESDRLESMAKLPYAETERQEPKQAVPSADGGDVAAPDTAPQEVLIPN